VDFEPRRADGSSVRFRDDILRGLRLGAILLALFIAGVAAYRIAREAPRAPVARHAPKPPSLRVPEARASKESSIPVPPPPPVAAGARKLTRTAAPPATRPAETENPPAAVLDHPPELEREVVTETAQHAEPAPEKTIEAPASPAPDQPPVKPEARPKRWLKAVGRFLHVKN
jgi:hypothetical protein